MSRIPLDYVLTNELKLIDNKGNKFSLSFGDADILGGYSYASFNINSTDQKTAISVDRDELDFITKSLSLNGSKVWTELNDGPTSGLNADLLDGLHAFDFMKTDGSNHYKHAFKINDAKRFVKIANFNVRKVGDHTEFNLDGTPINRGIFAERELNNRIIQDENIKIFNENTGINLNDFIFHSTQMQTTGLYNGTFRGVVTLLKENKPTTFDIHIGLFLDPKNNNLTSSAVKKFMYVSLHDGELPFINENYTNQSIKSISKELEDEISKRNSLLDTILGKKTVEQFRDDMLDLNSRASVTPPSSTETHDRPTESTVDYVKPSSPFPAYNKPSQFSPEEYVGKSYGQELDIARLYYTGSTQNMVDGVKVINHNYDLYVAVDDEMEVHVQPYMSSSCYFVNYEAPVEERVLPKSEFKRPLSIYDERYAHKNHRHYEYEQKIWHLIEEIDKIWDGFKHYVQINQGVANAKKVLMTDSTGKVFAANDNFERHKDVRRVGERVLVTNLNKCIAESSVLHSELSQLKNIKSNVQQQIDELLNRIKDIENQIAEIIRNIEKIVASIESVRQEISNIKVRVQNIENALGNYVRKAGDVMFGHLILDPITSSSSGLSSVGEPTLVFRQANGKSCKIYASKDNGSTSLGVWDNSLSKLVVKYMRDSGYVHFGSNTISLNGRRLTINNTAPSSPTTGDVWIKSW